MPNLSCSYAVQSLLVINRLDVSSTLIAQSSATVGSSALEFARVCTKRFGLRKSKNISITVASVKNPRNMMKSRPISLKSLEQYTNEPRRLLSVNHTSSFSLIEQLN